MTAKLTVILAVILPLAGCAPTAVVGVNPPSKVLMQRSPAADRLPSKSGMADLYKAYVRLKAQYGRARAREAGLQKYARTVSTR